tara:strand:- start:24310 stop:25539 length:1230 start_codon:yes stop_codon:yes gene_type:complete
MVLALATVLTLIFMYESRLKLTNHLMALLLPWVLTLIFSKYEISNLHKDLETYTYIVIFSFVIFYYLGYKLAQIFYRYKPRIQVSNIGVHSVIFNSIIVVYLFLTILNIVLAGYIPLISLILTGNSGYMDFGISGIYGFYNAFSNALGILAFYLFLNTKESIRKYKYLAITTLILLVFILFMTRQNIISLLVEMFIVYSFVRKDISYFKVFFLLCLLLLFFDVAGNARTANIFEIAEIKAKYYWLPSIVIWMYSYFYTNIVNLNNSVNFTDAPYYDGSSFSELLPNVVKNFFGLNFEHDNFLEKVNFTVSSAINELYTDFGLFEVVIMAIIFSFSATIFLRKIKYHPNSFLYIGIYSVFFFCSLFSFFVNFWFFLPIIFQLPMIYFLNRIIFIRRFQPYEQTKKLVTNR